MREKFITFLYQKAFLPATEPVCEDMHHLALYLFQHCPQAFIPVIRREFAYHHSHPPLEVMGLRFPWPGVILAAGFSKDGDGLAVSEALGANGVEAGTFPPTARFGNPRHARAAILPNGHPHTYDRVARFRDGTIHNWMNFPAPRDLPLAMDHLDINRQHCSIPVGVSFVESPDSKSLDQKLADIDQSVRTILAHNPSYVAYDPSCPNGTLSPKGQEEKMATTLATITQFAQTTHAVEAKNSRKTPTLVKISPDMKPENLKTVVNLVREQKLSGVIATNTTTDRNNQYGYIPTGGISGSKILFPKSLETVRLIRTFIPDHQEVTVVGCGGADSAKRFRQMQDAGADLIQVLTGFIYGGPYFFKALMRNLDQSL